jgi:hypothetical protein
MKKEKKIEIMSSQGWILEFQIMGAHLKKLRRLEGGTKIFGVLRVKNHDFTPKNHFVLSKVHLAQTFALAKLATYAAMKIPT